MSLRAIFRNPARSLVTVAATTVATALMVMTINLNRAVDLMLDFELNQVARHDLSSSLRDPVDLQASAEAQSIPGVIYAEARLQLSCEVRNGAIERKIGVTGLPMNSVLSRPRNRDGVPIEVPRTGLLLSRTLAEKLDIKAGETLQLRPLIGRRDHQDAVVAGIVDAYMGLPAYASVDYLSRLLGEEAVVNELLAKTPSISGEERVLPALGMRPTVIGVGQRRRSAEVLQRTFGDLMQVMLVIQILFAGLIAFGSVLNTSLVSFSEREREVGTLRVLGFASRTVAGIFASEGLLLGGLGILLGVPAGIAMVAAMVEEFSTDIFRFPLVLEPPLLLLAAVLTLFFLILAQAVVSQLIRRFAWLGVLKAHE